MSLDLFRLHTNPAEITPELPADLGAIVPVIHALRRWLDPNDHEFHYEDDFYDPGYDTVIARVAKVYPKLINVLKPYIWKISSDPGSPWYANMMTWFSVQIMKERWPEAEEYLEAQSKVNPEIVDYWDWYRQEWGI